MIYPLDIFTLDPVTNYLRPFMLFLAFERDIKLAKGVGFDTSLLNYNQIKGGFILPMPNTGMLDEQTANWESTNSVSGNISSMVQNKINATISGATLGTVNSSAQRQHILADPKLTRLYQGSQPRNWTGTWNIMPKNQIETVLVAALIYFLKYAASPSDAGAVNIDIGGNASVKFGKGKFLKEPYIWRILIINPWLQFAMRLDQMVLNSYSINYFPDGYASTYWDFFPKHIELTLSFSEFNFKTKEDWLSLGI